jgi:hypothetical protein
MMRYSILLCLLAALGSSVAVAAELPVKELPTTWSADPAQSLERTCFQTAQPWSGHGNLRSDVAIVYGIGNDLPKRMQTWRDHGYRVHLMTGVAWGNYQDYLSGKFDGTNHQDEEQTDRNGNPHRHGNSTDVFYMCPGTNYGKYLCVGIARALEAGAEAVHLEEPEFWVEDGYEEAFKREWLAQFHEPWQPPHSSVDAQWRASKLKYFLYRRALQQVFDFVQDYNQRTGRHVRCYVPTHSLINYAQWRIVSPESSLARLRGCDGYIAQVWTGTSRTPNVYRSELRERTFETAFLEYGAMQNLVRSTGRSVWYLNDPVEDNPGHDWKDYQANWESTLVASLFQPEVWQYEVAPWPERVFAGKYPRGSADRAGIPPAYATELQVVMNALNDMKQPRAEWDCGTTGIGVVVSDSLMFQRGQPQGSEVHLSHFYGLALPFLKRGMPVTPVQLENVGISNYLQNFKLILLSYHGLKPLSADVHAALAQWVKQGGALLFCDDDNDLYNKVREWWNSDSLHYATPREHLFKQLGIAEQTAAPAPGESRSYKTDRGTVLWLVKNPAELAKSRTGDELLVAEARKLVPSVEWREKNYLLLRRGPYLIAAGLDESSSAEPRVIQGHYINLFDPELKRLTSVTIAPGSRYFLLDLNAVRNSSPVLASACKTLLTKSTTNSISLAVEGVANTPAIVLLSTPPNSNLSPRVVLDGQPLSSVSYSESEHLLRVHFPNEPTPRSLTVTW